MRQNGHGTLTLDDARTWIEETGLCLFQPRRQSSSSIAPSFVEAVAGRRDSTPDPKSMALAEELLVRLEIDGVAVRLNLLGQPGEQPDYIVAGWVLPYVYALRGDRDWRRTPQLTGSRQVSQLAIQAHKVIETGDSNLADLTRTLGREVTEAAVLRAVTELWQQLRIIPVFAASGQPAQWQLLRQRFQKAIAEGASTSQVTAISVLASIYLQAVIAATMEEVEIFLSPLTARSKVREVLRGLVATRQVHSLSLGHAPHFYVAGTLPEFSEPSAVYASVSLPASAYFMRADDEEEIAEPVAQKPTAASPPSLPRKAAESHTTRATAARKPTPSGKSTPARPHFSRPAAHSRDRKPAQASASSRPARRASSDARPAGTHAAAPRPSAPRPTGNRAANGKRPASGSRWVPSTPATLNVKRNGAHPATASANGARSNGKTNGKAVLPAKGNSGARTSKFAAPAWNQNNGGKHNGNGHGNGNGAKSPAKSGATAHTAGSPRNGKPTRAGNAPLNASRRKADSRKPALAAGAKAGNGKHFGFAARPATGAKKRG
jgi:hypothetical protein